LSLSLRGDDDKKLAGDETVTLDKLINPSREAAMIGATGKISFGGRNFRMVNGELVEVRPAGPKASLAKK
jgi:hypothetical protein